MLRRTPDGRLWALQSWQPGDGPVQLRFSRWRGTPTRLLASVIGGEGVPRPRLLGQATFDGRPVTGTSPTPGGKPVRHFVWIECFGCTGELGWSDIAGVAPAASGTFSLLLRPGWIAPRYRVSVTGPNGGTTYAPDASVIAEQTGIPP